MYIDCYEQIEILSNMIDNGFDTNKRTYNFVKEEIYGNFELNKANNIHFHGIIFIDEKYNYEINYANIQKVFMRACKTNSYGVKIEKIKILDNVIKYCNKSVICQYTNSKIKKL